MTYKAVRLALLNSGRFAVIDEIDAERALRHTWRLFRARQACERYYACTYIRRERVFLHRFILGPVSKPEIDHRNGDGLDNTRRNLRPATRAENSANRAPYNKTGLKGVSPKGAGFCAFIASASGKIVNLGYFKTPEEAARAYDAAAIQRWGEYARLNFPSDAAPA